MKIFKTNISLALIILTFASFSKAESCLTGKFEIRGYNDTAAKYSFRLISNKRGANFVSEVLNPGEEFIGSDHKGVLVGTAFQPDNINLIPDKGVSVRCPCTALQSKNGELQILIEHLGDGSSRTKIDYFGFKIEASEVAECK